MNIEIDPITIFICKPIVLRHVSLHLDFSSNKTKHSPCVLRAHFKEVKMLLFPVSFFQPNLNNTKENEAKATPGFQGTQWRGRSPKATSRKAHQVPFSSSSSRRQRPPLPIRGTVARNGLTCHFTTWKLNSPCLILPPAIVPSVK